jgi:hypothetical protein
MELLGIFEAQIDWVLLCFHRQFRDYNFDMYISTLTFNQDIIFLTKHTKGAKKMTPVHSISTRPSRSRFSCTVTVAN